MKRLTNFHDMTDTDNTCIAKAWKLTTKWKWTKQRPPWSYTHFNCLTPPQLYALALVIGITLFYQIQKLKPDQTCIFLGERERAAGSSCELTVIFLQAEQIPKSSQYHQIRRFYQKVCAVILCICLISSCCAIASFFF